MTKAAGQKPIEVFSAMVNVKTIATGSQIPVSLVSFTEFTVTHGTTP